MEVVVTSMPSQTQRASSGDDAGTCADEGGDPEPVQDGITGDLPDVTDLSLDEIRTSQSPVLRRALERLTEELGDASEAVAGFNSSL